MAKLVIDDRERLCFMSTTGVQHLYDARTELGRNMRLECNRPVRGSGGFEAESGTMCSRCARVLAFYRNNGRWHAVEG